MLLRRYHGILQKKYEERNKPKQEEIVEVEVEQPVLIPDIDDITVREIKKELDNRGIDYSPYARKVELYELLRG